MKIMTKKDEFIEKIEQLNPHLKVQKFDDMDGAYKKLDMIVWYVLDEFKVPFATFTHCNDLPVVKTDCTRFSKDDLALYSKVIKLCSDYFSCFYLGEDYL